MTRNDFGNIVLSPDDEDGVRALIAAKKRACVDIHFPTEPAIRDFVLAWEAVTGEDL